MTVREHDFYDRLNNILGNEYHVLPQVHLSKLLDHTVKGQNWNAAFRHINGKSVDYVVADKKYMSPILAIELDDSTHDAYDRLERDGEVERILGEAGVPLARFRHVDQIDEETMRLQIKSKIRQ